MLWSYGFFNLLWWLVHFHLGISKLNGFIWLISWDCPFCLVDWNYKIFWREETTLITKLLNHADEKNILLASAKIGLNQNTLVDIILYLQNGGWYMWVGDIFRISCIYVFLLWSKYVICQCKPVYDKKQNLIIICIAW